MAKKPSKRRKVRLALIGAGAMANAVHYPSLREMDDVEMAAICDMVAEKAQETAQRFGIGSVYDDHRRMLDEVKPDAVYVLMPPHQMLSVACDVLDRKRHLFIEKPPGLNAFQNQQLALRAKRCGVIAMCGFQRRYVPLIEAMRKRVEKKSPLHTVAVQFVKHSFPEAAYYGGVIDILRCDAVHAVDTLRHLCGGDVVSVASDVRSLGADGPNAFYALIKFSTGVTGILMSNWACGRRFFTVEMHGQGVSAYAEPDSHGMLYRGGDEEGVRYDPAECAGSDTMWHRLGFYDENRHFIDCVKKGKKPLSNLADTVKTMELVDTIYRSQI